MIFKRGKENGLQILQSIDQGPFELGTTRNTLRTTPKGGVLLGLERPRTYDDLSDTEKKRYDADVYATNIVLQGLPKDIYKLISHNIEAKAIWDNVKMLLAGSELTKEDRESQLYDEFEPKLMDTTVGRVVPLLPIAPARTESELDASVDRLFDEGGSGNLVEQGDSAGGGHVVGTPLVSEAAETVVEDVAPLQPKRQRKRKTVVSDTSGPSYPPKKLREDHRTSIGLSVAGTSMSTLQRLLAGAVLNPEVGIAALPTLPFIISSVSLTLERESEDQTDSMAGANLRTITAP
ncbi:hypothetical protein Tco_1395734, partial [Tanacetum coccineum]